MENEDNKLWFKAKRYGWGWTPCSWQGWIVLLIWLTLFVFSVVKIDRELVKNVFVIIIMFFVLIYICYKKGEKPRWRWGK
jgi:uncharacterized membrane protein YhaH (DUF805 family)